MSIDDLLGEPIWGATSDQLRAIIMGLNEGVSAFDMDGNLLFINDKGLELYGFEGKPRVRDNIASLDNLFEIRYPNGETVPAENYPATRVLRGETFSNFELWLRRRGTERRWLASYSGTQVEDTITIGVLTMRDLTHEHELTARVKAVFEINPTAISVIRLADLRFTEVNESFLRLTGYDRGEVIGKTADDLGMHLERNKRAEALRRLQGGETDVIVEHEAGLRTKSGDSRQVLSEGRIITFENDPHLIDTYLDITTRKQTEEEMHRAIQQVMSDTGWFSRRIMEKLAGIRSGSPGDGEVIELSRREEQVLERLAVGMGNEAIAKDLGIATQTVRNYISTIYDKLGVHSRAEAVVWARERGFVGL